MDKTGVGFLLLLIFAVYLSLIYIPHNQLTVHRASAKLQRIHIENAHGFSLTHLQTSKSQPSGPPYLFLHGHKGSVKQAISMTKFFENQGVNINMYSIDFSEGAVAISHSLLLKESEFAQECIEEIYRRHSQPLVILAHSFGGIIASLALIDLNPSFVKGMITLSTPFEAPPINNDIYFIYEYSKIHEYWRTSEKFVISITGGVRDLTVPPQLTNIKELGAKNSLHLYSTEISGLHCEIDHLAMVWGFEFFEKLSQIIRVVNENSKNKVLKGVRNAIQSDISRIVMRIRDEETVEVLASHEPLHLNEITKELKFNDYYYYVLKLSESKIITDRAKLERQVIKIKNFEGFGFLQGIMGIQLNIRQGENLATFIRLGKAFAENRYPVRVKILGEGQIQAMHSICGHEEIIKYNENDFVLYFHEKCEDGPELWLFGYDIEYDYLVEIKIDVLASIVCLTRDFRLHMFACMFFIALSYLTPYCYKLQLVGAIILYSFGSIIRNIPWIDWEKPHDQEITYGLFDIAFIYVAGRGLYTLFFVLFKVFKYINQLVDSIKFMILLISPLVFYYPWAYCSLLCIVASSDSNTLFIAYLNILSTLPVQFGWYIALFTHNIYSTEFQILPPLFLSLTQLFCPKISIKDETTIICLLIAFTAHDLLYRISIILHVFCIYLGFKSLAAGFLNLI